jgi:cation diffusion facilitator CzcD-associated flavoprotein CzcO
MFDTTSHRSGARSFHVAIIGAGFSGIGLGIRLKQAGIQEFTIYEAADRIGGTWRDNVYPGAACDVPTHLYSYSFARKPDWSRKYGPQAEILAYLERCVADHGLDPHIRFGTKIVGARWDDDERRWHLRAEAGAEIEANVVVSATGPLSQPAFPTVEGLDRFSGPVFHSARWPSDVSLEGKRVAVVGTGASAIQIVPELASQVRSLHLFQRTPAWVIPKPDRAFSKLERFAFERVPGLEWLYRAGLYWEHESRAIGFVQTPKLLTVLGLPARLHLRRAVRDATLRHTLTPNYTIGCKRVLLSNDYYPALQLPHVEVIPSAVQELTEHGAVAADGTEREVDAVVLATGFDVQAFLAHMDVVGRDGRELNEVWQHGAEAYFGLAVSGFPNLFILIGPNTGLGHNSMIFMIEAQVHYIKECIRTLRDGEVETMDVRPERQRRHNDALQARMKETVWTTGCKSWYLDETGRNFTLWPGFTFEYWLRTRRVRWPDYRLEKRQATVKGPASSAA